MKVLIIGDISGVFAKDLAVELNKKEIKTDLLDISSLELVLYDSSIDKSYSEKLSRYKKIPKINVLIKFFLIAKIIKNNDFDLVNIHYSTWQYLLLLKVFKKSDIKLVITFYGSDFYRTSVKIKNRQRPLYKAADALTFTNPATKESFLDYYQDFEEKSHVCRFGLKTLDYIDKNSNKSRESIKKYLGYNIDKLIVTCGYNSTKAQQHEKMIEAFKKLNADILSKVQFVFPLTYGDNIHKNKVIKILESSSLDYIVLKSFLYEDDNAYIKLASDIMINVLLTDSFSGSMQEFLYAKNIVVTGEWLPYELFDESGIKYIKISEIENDLLDKLEYAIEHIDNLKKELEYNKNIIRTLSSWDENIQTWINTFGSVK